ncbi:MAG: hypothetical protein AAF394_03535, partial [Planctomycetota bacterium]
VEVDEYPLGIDSWLGGDQQQGVPKVHRPDVVTRSCHPYGLDDADRYTRNEEQRQIFSPSGFLGCICLSVCGRDNSL